MSLFQLDPPRIAARVHASGKLVRLPTLGESLVRGIAGFIAVSFAGLAPWPVIDRWFPAAGETGLYIACTVMFVGACGPFLHRLIIGPGSLSRFYKLFALAFIAHAIAWVALWMSLRNDWGILAGLFAGAAAMGVTFAFAFDAWRAAGKTVGALAVLITLGFETSLWIEGKLGPEYRLAAMFMWAVCYGGCFGAGLGIAFHLCQSEARRLIAENVPVIPVREH